MLLVVARENFGTGFTVASWVLVAVVVTVEACLWGATEAKRYWQLRRRLLVRLSQARSLRAVMVYLRKRPPSPLVGWETSTTKFIGETRSLL